MLCNFTSFILCYFMQAFEIKLNDLIVKPISNTIKLLLILNGID